MTLPDYFLADLPAQAEITPAMITEACQTLKRNRERFLAGRKSAQIVRTLAGLARDWLDPEFPFRQLALDHGPGRTRFSRQTIEAGLDAFFAQVTQENLEALVERDLGHKERLDRPVSSESEQELSHAAMAHGSDLLVHVTGGVLPNPILTGMMLGLLTKSAQFLKCATGTSFLPRVFAHSLYAAEPKLGACLELAEWKGGHHRLEAALFAEAGRVVCTGRDETLAEIRARVPAGRPFLGYGHRLSFAHICHETLFGANIGRLARRFCQDVAAWDQQGCLSPHVVYVEKGGPVAPTAFAEALAKELAAHEELCPRGRITSAEAAAIATRRGFYEVRASHDAATKLWCSPDSTAWTVVHEEDPLFAVSCLNRFVYVKSVASLEQALVGADAARRHVSTVGLAAPDAKHDRLALELARWGAGRVCPIGQMQNPPLTWRHDGRPALADLVTWTDVELGA